MDALQNLLALRNLDLSELKERYKIKDTHTETDVKYQKLSGLTRLYNPDILPVYFFLQNNKAVLIYSSDPAIVNTLNGKQIIEQYGDGEEHYLRSRAGKKSNLMTYPEAGFAVSVERNDVEFIEVFQPMTLEQYKKEIYIEPGPFIR